MSYLGRTRCATLFSFACLLTLSSCDCRGQSYFVLAAIGHETRNLEFTDDVPRGSVLDPSGARIPHAIVTIRSTTRDAKSIEVTADSEGYFSVPLALGNYVFSASAPGFAAATTTMSVTESTRRITLSLAIATRSEQVAVPIDASQSTAASDNASAIVFAGADLNILSGDDATFQKEIAALAGVSGQSAEIFVNGFAGRMPPRQTIREVRINSNPYSAAFDRIGIGRAEIFTKPGGDELHGLLQVSGNASAMNGQNPYTGVEPPSSAVDYAGNLNGPLGTKTSFFLAGEDNIQDFNSLVNAYTLGAMPRPVSESVASPLHHLDWDARFDRQFTANNTLTARYQFDQSSAIGGGLTGQVLPEASYNNGITTQTLQLLDSEVVSTTLEIESRVQYVRTRLTQNAVSGTPSILIEGVTTDGGNAQQSLRDNQDALEFNETLAVDRGPHLLHFGARYRLGRDANLSTANYNGTYIYPSLAAYQQNAPTQFSYTSGKPNAVVFAGDLAAFAEDEWRLAKHFTMDLGFRLESQSAIPDHIDPAPRVGFAWALFIKKKQLFRLRGGAGFFYDRFALNNLLTTVRQNGISQQTFILNSNTVGSATAVPPTTYTLAPGFKAESAFIGGLGLDRTLGRRGRLAVVYYYIGGAHQSLSRNVNAPDPGTGIRPFGTPQNIYQFTSNGNEKVHTLRASFTLQAARWLSLWGDGTLQNNRANTAGATSFPSNGYDLRQDYGRASAASKVLFTGATAVLPWKLNADFFVDAQSGLPFDITTGTDLNGDGIYNDRPAFATNPTVNSVLYKTRFGTFDANPQAQEAIIPKNYGNSPGFYFVQLTARRSFPVGPRAASPMIPPGVKGPSLLPERKWAIGFAVEAANLLNTNNPAPPVGTLNSPYFGKSIALNNPFGANPAANRVVTLRTSFTF
jgi:hypothetical protein